MNRLSSFILGIIVGAAGLYVSENYYIVRATDSYHLVPKVASKLEFPYRDIRAYTAEDWRNNVSLGMAIAKANKAELMLDSYSGVRQNFESLLQSLGGGS